MVRPFHQAEGCISGPEHEPRRKREGDRGGGKDCARGSAQEAQGGWDGGKKASDSPSTTPVPAARPEPEVAKPLTLFDQPAPASTSNSAEPSLSGVSEGGRTYDARNRSKICLASVRYFRIVGAAKPRASHSLQNFSVASRTVTRRGGSACPAVLAPAAEPLPVPLLLLAGSPEASLRERRMHSPAYVVPSSHTGHLQRR
jgi:hypothetical protein